MLFGTVRRTDWRVRTSNDLLRLEQAVEWIPSWDCRESCHHDPKGDHGQGGEMLRFLLRAPDAALSLKLRTNLRRGGPIFRMDYGDADTYQPVEPAIRADWFHLHLGMRTEAEQVRLESPPTDCDVLSSGVCYAGPDGVLAASALWTPDDSWAARHVLTNEKVDELFLVGCIPVWKRMVDMLLAERDKMLTAHAQLPHRCPMCHGAGLVPSVSLSQFNPPLP